MRGSLTCAGGIIEQSGFGVASWFEVDGKEIMAPDDTLMFVQTFKVPEGLSGPGSPLLTLKISLNDQTEKIVEFRGKIGENWGRS